MGKTAVLMFLVFLVILGFFAIENKDTVTIKIPFESAYEMSKMALILLSTSFGALVVLIIFFFRDTKRAIDNRQYQKRQRKESRIREFYAKALDASLGNKEQEAKDALSGILKEDPENTNALLKLGDIAFSQEDYATALEYYRKVREIHPRNLQVLLSLGAVMERMESLDEALKYLDDILDKDQDNLSALLRKRAILEKRDKWDDLLPLQKTVAKLQAGERQRAAEERRLAGYTYEYARSSLESGEPEKAEKSFRTLIKADEGFIPAYLGLAEVMLQKKDAEEAINFLEKSFERLRSFILLARLEDILINAGEPGRLIRLYRNSLSRNPNDSELKFLLGRLYFRLEMIEDAAEIFESAEMASFSSPAYHCMRGELFARRNMLPMAVEQLRKACSTCHSPRTSYHCTACSHRAGEWSGRCPTCGEWNTFGLDIHGVHPF